MKKYNNQHTLEEWVSIIENNFNGIPLDCFFNNKWDIIPKIYSIEYYSEEWYKIIKSCAIIYGKQNNLPLSYEEACIKLNISNEIPNKYKSKKTKARYKLEIITRCLNDGWKPNWDDFERKYYPKFKINEEGNWEDYCYSWDRVINIKLEIFYLKSDGLAQYMGIIFTELYQEYNNEKFIFCII